MEYEIIKEQINAELQNKKTNDKLLEKIAIQLKKIEKAETVYLKEKAKLENLVVQKQNLSNGVTTKQVEQDKEE
ncbi:Uncharacterised protein [Campylobacter hyointestinalis subsp. hyointestinalis]|uniref:Uncharacterized protein n=1 Tax=Campylobacter hyointestinalis subsp. hyointestinalis TaxID=91352 RepID=A0A9W5AT68_CAMHY|nr:hypothetical protein [Campylobacter hyointestinalis]CUU72664.1 Uncharacterised protein [Campylobacter hyointestinalis subsp. hyointestinalis]CUU72665.1 Uncharacterised protein [Campylobacter hyointestinalis subsp. hyointestinalis]CUU84410.1 Uncharacterised protein [Campylobacter hyointestinalis subsp. hyointestinalis]